jgi:hypothetical protein
MFTDVLWFCMFLVTIVSYIIKVSGGARPLALAALCA